MSNKDLCTDESCEGWLRIVSEKDPKQKSSKKSVLSIMGSAMRLSSNRIKRYYFRIDVESMSYFKTQKMKSLVGEISIKNLLNVCPIVGAQIPNTFDLSTSEKLMRLAAESSEELKMWLLALYTKIPKQRRQTGLCFNPSLSSYGSNISALTAATSTGSSRSFRSSISMPETWLMTQKKLLEHDPEGRERMLNKKSIVYATLVPGGMFKKFNKRCRAQLRNVRIDKDLKQVIWSDASSIDKIKGTLKVKDIVGIQIGCTTACFPSSSTMELQNRCFSIITSDRSLDLQVNADEENRDDWVRMFRYLTVIRWLEDTPFAEEEDIEDEEAEQKEDNQPLLDLNTETLLPPDRTPPSTPGTGIPSKPPPTSPSSRRRLVKKKSRRGSNRSVASVDLDAAMKEMLDLNSACRQKELSEIVSMSTLSNIDLDKLYKEGPKTKIHTLISKQLSEQSTTESSHSDKNVDDDTSKIPEKSKSRAESTSHRDTTPVEMTGMNESEGKDGEGARLRSRLPSENRPRLSSVQTGDLSTLELEPFDLPPSWKDANAKVEELKAAYKAAKHAFYKDKTNETLKKNAVHLKARLRAVEKHLSTLQKPAEEQKPVKHSKWRARKRNKDTTKQQRSTAMPWAPKY